MNARETIRSTIADTTAGLFAHADYPLAHSLEYRGDPGLFGPGSPSWEVLGDVASFVGGIRALLIQAAHPEVVAGVADHSTYATDPLGRLSRTSSYVTATGFGAMPEVEQAIAAVRRAHGPVRGVSHRGERYSASMAPYAAWVHNVLVDSFLAAHQAFGPAPLDRRRADEFVAEQTRLGSMMGASDLPSTAAGLGAWISDHHAIDRSPGMVETIRFLRAPPLPPAVRVGYGILFRAAVTTIPDSVADLLSLRPVPGAATAGHTMIRGLRWAMGSSPSWWLALERCSAEPPRGVEFRRQPPLAVEA